MGRVFMSGIVSQKTAPVTFKSNFADNDWSTIIKACQTNKVPDTWTVGSQKTMTINGTDYAIDIIGKNHDTYSNGSGTAPLTFQLHDCYATAYAMDTAGNTQNGWTNCTMRKTYLPAIMALMPSEVQGSIKEVTKKTCKGYFETTIVTTSDKLFLLAPIEVSGEVAESGGVSGEGLQYSYYKSGTWNDNYFNKGQSWWLRSPKSNSATDFLRVNFGQAGDAGNCSATLGVSFAFCF